MNNEMQGPLTRAQQHATAATAEAERHLKETNVNLNDMVARLRARTSTQHTLARALAARKGEHGIAEVLHESTGLAVCVEDNFGHVRAWAGPGQPPPHPQRDPTQQKELLHLLARHGEALRVKGRVASLMSSGGQTLGVLSLVDPSRQAGDEQVAALEYAATILVVELAHQRDLAEVEHNLRRDLLDDLLLGTEDSVAYARAAALGHDLRRSHYVVLVHHPDTSDGALSTAACQAAATLRLQYLHGRGPDGTVVLVVDGRPDPHALYKAISHRLDSTAVAIGIGSACPTPSALPQSFDRACRALNIRLHRAMPAGASAYDELGFYRLIDAAHTAGAAEDYVQEWLGVLQEYDQNKNSNLVQTLSHYLECGGNYDETAAALHIHRSTLRYRLARIAELTGHELSNVDTRFNLHAATRTWRFLDAATAPPPPRGPSGLPHT